MRYVGHRASETNPLRSIPTFRPAAILIRVPAPAAAAPAIPTAAPGHAYRTPTAAVLLQQDLANAEARLRDASRVYDVARAGIGEANRRTLPDTLPTFIRAQMGQPIAPVTLSAERVRQRKAYAFRLFNQRRGELARARRAVGAARAALGLPSMHAVAERSTVKATVRAAKRQPLHPIAQAALAF